MTVLGSGSPVTIGPPVVLASFMEHWVLSQGLVPHLAPLIFPASYFGVIHEAPTVCLPFTIKTNQLEKLEAAKAAGLVCLSLLSLPGSFLVNFY